MSRRVILLIALISLAVLGAAAAPWTVRSAGLAAALSAHVKERYGLDVTVGGRSVFAILPIPQVKFEKVTVRLPNDAVVAEGGTLRGELRLWPLAFGRIELSDVALSGARITASSQRLQALNWAEFIKARASYTYARRLILDRSTVTWTDWPEANLRRADLVVSWTGADEPLYAAGSAIWRDETVTLEQASLHPLRLASDQLSPVSLSLVTPFARAAIAGEAQWGDDPRITGESTVQATSVRNLTNWSGLKLPLGSLVQNLSIKGDFSANRRRLAWPSVAVTLGSDKLDGTLAVRFDTDRPLITGTLAAGKLNLSTLFSPFLQTRTDTGSWSDDDIDLVNATGSNLDLRLSATTAVIGALRFGDMAANVLVRPGKIEASLGRADFHNGTLKGRMSLAAERAAVEFKSQGTFTGVEIAPFLSAIGQTRWITGVAQGQFQLEGTGGSPADLVKQAHGRSSITVKDGELVGIALNDAMRRVEKRPLLASLNWKGGRTPFDHTQMQITVKDGVGAVSDSRLVTPDLVTSMQGQVSLIERTLNLKADVAPVGPDSAASSGIGFEVTGGWDNVDVIPDVRSLIERSGAAKPLFGTEAPGKKSGAPLANAQ